MATQNKITEMIAAIKTIYPYYAKDADVATLVKTWTVLLKEYPDKAVEVAFYKCLQTCKMPPTPADVIENLKAMLEASEPTDEELWAEYTLALKKAEKLIYYFRFNAIQSNGLTQGENARNDFNALWEALPERVKQFVGGKSEFHRTAINYDPDELKFERTRFMKTMPIIKQRQEFNQLTLLLQNGDAVLRLGGDSN